MAEASGKDVLAAFGTAVRESRLQLGISQERLAELAGLHRTYVGSVERGEWNVSLLNIERLARAVELRPSQLLARMESAATTPPRGGGRRSRLG